MSDIIISGITIRRDEHGRYCLNDLHRASGMEKRHQPSDWLRIQQTQDLITELGEAIPGIPGIQSKQGLGTFVAKELVYAYAMWISAAFHLKVIRAYDTMVTAAPAPVELTRMELIQLAMAAEQEKLELVAKLEEQAPKVEIVDRISEATNTLCIRDAAKTLQVQPSKLTQWLLVNKWIYHRPGKAGYLAYQDRIQSCHLIHKSTPYRNSETGEERVSEQVRITGRGLTLLAQKLNEGGVGLFPIKPPKGPPAAGIH